MIALTDLETTGLNPYVHEILELGLILVDEDNDFAEVDRYIVKVAPYKDLAHRHQWAAPKALQVNGYTPEAWEDATPLVDVMKQYSKLTKEARFLAFNVTFDWTFILKAFELSRVVDQMRYQRLDLLSLAWAQIHIVDGNKDAKLSLRETCIYFGVEPEGEVHRAAGGVEAAHRLLKAWAQRVFDKPRRTW